MKRAGLVLVLLTGACAATPTPTRDELARAIENFEGTAVAPTDLTHITCRSPPVVVDQVSCSWRQREGRRWVGMWAYLDMSGDRWQLMDAANRRP